MTTVTIEEAQAQLPELILRLRSGEEITITDRSKPLAQVKKAQLPNSRLRPPPGLGRGIIEVNADDNEHLKDFAEYMP